MNLLDIASVISFGMIGLFIIGAILADKPAILNATMKREIK